MKTLAFQSKDTPLRISDFEKPKPGQGELLVKLHYAAINQLDLWIRKKNALDTPVATGLDGSGVVIEAGPNTDKSLVGKEVIINPILYWGADEKTYRDKYEIVGEPFNGTFTKYMLMAAEYVYEKPAHLTMEEATALLLAASTAYNIPFTKARNKAANKVLFTGINCIL